jgi:hypothetical protein
MKCPKCGFETSEGMRFCGNCGLALLSQQQVQSNIYVPLPQKPPFQIRVNILCLVGAIVGVLSLFLSWVATQDTSSGQISYLGAFDFDTFPSTFHLSVDLFLIGTVIAFFLSLGGILQLMGSAGFLLTSMTYATYGQLEVHFWYGAIIALASSLLVIIGLIVPYGYGFGTGSSSAAERLLTVSFFRWPS